MNYTQNNPLTAALIEGLEFPIHAKLIGANGCTAEVLFESAKVCHTISFHPPIDFPFEWTLTDSSQATAEFTQTAADAEQLFERVQKRLN